MIAKFLAAATLLLAASNACAQGFDEPRWYGALDLGYNWPGEIDSRSTGNAPDGKPYDYQWKFKDNFAIGSRLGYRVTPHLRLEGEFDFERTAVASAHAPGAEVGGVSANRPGEPWGLCSQPPSGGKCAPASGLNTDITAIYTGTLNAIYDVRPDRKINPFFGAGVGITHIEMLTTYWFSNVPGQIGPTNPQLQTVKLAGSLTTPGEIAFKGLAGVSYRIAPRMHLDLTYHYDFTPWSIRWNPMNNTTPRLAQNQGLQPGDFLGQFRDQLVTVGVRYAF